MSVSKDPSPKLAPHSSRKIEISRIISSLLAVIALAYLSPLRSHLDSGLHKAYEWLQIHGEFVSGPANSSETVFLVGDAGAMTNGVALALGQAIRSTKTPPSIVYLGDNIYPLGLPKEQSSPEWRLAASLLLRQINPFRDSSRGIFFIPGNHDWENHSANGWDAIKREGAFIDSSLGPGHMAPTHGCPGPSKIALFPDLQAIAIDSSWWLHEHLKPTRAEDGCATFSDDTIVSALDSMLKDTPAGVETLFLLHHPLLPADSDHAHATCPFSPDCPTYISMREKISAVLAKYPPLLCASGHNHSLQVHRDQSGCRTYAVSGGASTVYRVAQPKAAQFSESSLGFMILHRESDHAWKLDVVRVRGDESPLPPSSTLAYSTTLK